MGEVGEHGRGVVAVDKEVANLIDRNPSLLGQLGTAAVLIQTHHGGEAISGQTLGLGCGDHDICVAGIAHHGDTGVISGDSVDRLTLGDENLAVILQKVCALHAGAAGLGPHQQTPVSVLEGHVGFAGQNHVLQQGEGAVFQFHGHPLQRLLRALNWDFQKLQDDRLILAEHFAGRDTEQQGIADIARCAGNRHAKGCLSGHGRSSRLVGRLKEYWRSLT